MEVPLLHITCLAMGVRAWSVWPSAIVAVLLMLAQSSCTVDTVLGGRDV